MLGNDDLLAADEMFDNLCDRFENVCNIAGRKFSVNGYEFIGMNCGIMDQFAIIMGRKDNVIYLDTASAGTVEGVLPEEARTDGVHCDKNYNEKILEYIRKNTYVRKTAQ